MLVHTIRLREPWTRCQAEGGERLTRRFAAPTGVGLGEQIFLAVGDLDASALVLVNGQELGRLIGGECGRWNITNSLMPRNEVCLVMERTPLAIRGSGRELLVRLEIETGD